MNYYRIVLFLAWVVAVVATLGSLYFSKYLGFPPCELCWYQRIFMYPLSFLLFIGLWLNDRNCLVYALPLVVVGGGIAIYHNLLIRGVIPQEMQVCSGGINSLNDLTFGTEAIPCSITYINWWGFINIPLLSLSAFVLIFIALMVGVLQKAKMKI